MLLVQAIDKDLKWRQYKQIYLPPHNPFRYRGEYHDLSGGAGTGFIYLRNRFYDPSIGRFISADPYWNVGNMIFGDLPENDPNNAFRTNNGFNTSNIINTADIIRRQQIVESNISAIFMTQRMTADEKIIEVSRWQTGQLNAEQRQTLERQLNGGFVSLDDILQRENDRLEGRLSSEFSGVTLISYTDFRIPSIEAIMQASNLYVYVMNNPIMFIDPSGFSGLAFTFAYHAEMPVGDTLVVVGGFVGTAGIFTGPIAPIVKTVGGGIALVGYIVKLFEN